jgi:hypothetical protein
MGAEAEVDEKGEDKDAHIMLAGSFELGGAAAPERGTAVQELRAHVERRAAQAPTRSALVALLIPPA